MAQIHVLPPETARLIAAGEVIDRPASALRELLDNAVDSGATTLRVETEQGGRELIRVSDDGCGMDRDDLELSILDHATSKIRTADDLLAAKTLGFRGEALASIAAVSRLEILTRARGAGSGWRLRKEPGSAAAVEAAASVEGTTITVRGIFEQFPARRQFLKSASYEGSQCRSVLVEKAMAFPALFFGWDSGRESFNLPPATRRERIALLYPELPGPLLREFGWEDSGVSCSIIYTDPSFHRSDRKYLQVFVNRRRVLEWGLSGAVEYSFSPWLPGGMRPCAFLFTDIDPSLADFNIHPAKREVRIKDLERIKSGLYKAFSDHLRNEFGPGPTDLSQPASDNPNLFPPGIAGRSSGYPWAAESRVTPGFGWKNLAPPPEEIATAADRQPVGDFRAPRYLGRAFGPYLVAELNDTLFLVDQHAAHERILYDELKSSGSATQSLLVPHVVECEPPALAWLQGARAELEHSGYLIEFHGDSIAITGVPAFLGEKAVRSLAEALEETNFSPRATGATFGPVGVSTGSPTDELLARLACRSAVKDGDILDDASARDLIRKAFALPFPRCPHGRPIWASIDRASLDRMVGRLLS